ncbi:MAG: ATP-binding protein [Candidatus Nanopelagicales bacterium]|nr:ATP-binding protein [Candidatus Nanopelagicales bacterium]
MGIQLCIAVLGGESTGKTTLAHALAAGTNGIVVTEALRNFVEEHGRTPEQSEQREIMQVQRDREIHAITDNPSATILCDPATTMTSIYSQLYFQDSSLHDLALEYASHYDALLWCRPDIPWVAEAGQHDGPQFRQAADQLIAHMITELERVTTVLEITGTDGRIALARELLGARFSSVWQQAQAHSST